MATERVETPVNPKVLIWAREIIHLPKAKAADRIGVKEERLDAWESGAEKPSFTQLINICDAYKRSPSVFFLAEPPKEEGPPKDFRQFGGGIVEPLSTKALIEFRRAIDRRDAAVEMATLLGEAPRPFAQSIGLRDNVAEAGLSWRKRFGLTRTVQDSWTGEYDALSFWKDAVETQGVLVQQLTVESLGEFRGATVFFTKFPLILLNSKDSPRGKIFSLLHEIGHVLLHVSGIGNTEPPVGRSDPNNRIEVFCNAFAAACAIPDSLFLAEPEVLQLGDPDSDLKVDFRILSTLSKRYQVGLEVVARRLLENDKITQNEYHALRNTIRLNAKKAAPSSGGPDIVIRRLAQNGKRLTNLALRAHAAGHITTSDLSTVLGLKLNHLPKLQQQLSRKRA